MTLSLALGGGENTDRGRGPVTTGGLDFPELPSLS